MEALYATIVGLSMKYWNPRILMTVARGVGIPLQIYQATRERKCGYYALILTEADLSGPLPNFITIELPDHGLHYENLSARSSSCQSFGCSLADCRGSKASLKVGHMGTVNKNKQIYKQGEKSLALVKTLDRSVEQPTLWK